jgi:hypothetical protein
MARDGAAERPATVTASAQTRAAIVLTGGYRRDQAATAGLPTAPRAAHPEPNFPGAP